MYDITTIGTATQDIFLKSKQFKTEKNKEFPTGKALCFEAGAKIEIEQIKFDTGGGATNSAVTFGRLGLKTMIFTAVGRDGAGREIKRVLENERVKTTLISQRVAENTSLSIILLEEKGERTVLVHRGALLSYTDLPLKRIKTRWIYLTSVGGNLRLLEKIAAHVREKNIKLAFNPGKKELKLGLKKLFPILDTTSVLILNREEASFLMGLPYSFAETIFRKACGLTPGIEVITDGRNGAYVADEGQAYKIGIYDYPLVDRLGAGDAFGSGFVGGLIKYHDTKKALQYAAANASSVVTKIGAKEGIIKEFPHNPLEVSIKAI